MEIGGKAQLKTELSICSVSDLGSVLGPGRRVVPGSSASRSLVVGLGYVLTLAGSCLLVHLSPQDAELGMEISRSVDHLQNGTYE